MFSRKSERGQGTLEVVGIIAVAAVLIGAVTIGVTQSSPSITGTIKDGICKVVSLGKAECDSAPEIRAAEDYVPSEQCVVGSSGEESESSISFVVTASDGETWLVEDLGNGKSRLTRTTSGGLGAGVGVGFDVTVKVDGDKYGLALTASASAMLKGVEGKVYYADNNEQAKAILQGKQTDDTKDTWLGDGGPLRWVGDKIHKNKYEEAEPDEWFEEGGLDFSGYAGGTGIYGSAGVEASEKAFLGRRHKKDGTETAYFRGSASITASADSWDGDQRYKAVAQAGMESLVAVEKDKDGNPVSLKVTTTVMTDAQAGAEADAEAPEYTKRTIQIPVKSKEDRAVASRALGAMGIPVVPGITSKDALATPLQMKDAATDFGNLARESGYVYEQKYTETTNKDNGVNFDAKAIAEVGFSGSEKATQKKLTDYKYWDGSGMASRPGCASSGSSTTGSSGGSGFDGGSSGDGGGGGGGGSW